MTYQVSVILLAGGTGQRMQAPIPKQFLPIQNKTIAAYSLDVFLKTPEVSEIIIVCDPQFRHHLEKSNANKAIKFALPGLRRQDSVFNGLSIASKSSDIICIHDSARPFITQNMVSNVISTAYSVGASAAAVPVKFTIKEINDKQFVKNTPDRSTLWEIQTPQAIKADILQKGFIKANEINLTVTDDVSLVELLGLHVKLVEGAYTNLKITTPDDLIIAEQLVNAFRDSH